jgi:hypothetical protein
MATSIFDQDLILPGSITEIISDYSYGYDTSLFGTTESVVIIGTAFNGPVGKPVEIYSPEHAKYIFGGSFDFKTRREATLVAEIQDTWDRGCRTIFAVRATGKSIYKDFQLSLDTKLKLRVSGIFPSNSNKDVYFTFDNSVNNMSVKVFKPSERATIQEKMQGLISSGTDSVLISTLDISGSYGLTKEDTLVQLIKIVNDYASNNVIRLSLVDEYGNDVTLASKEAQGLAIGAMFPGAYFIGRDSNKCSVSTDLVFSVASENNKPYESFEGTIFKTLELNTDVNKDLPIYGKTVDVLNKKFITAEVTMSEMFDILAVSGKIDKVFGKDKADYEEVEVSDFELYKTLGSGFAVTAKAENKGSGVKVKETSVIDDNRIAPLTDGLYSMLENLTSDIRILANGNADAVIGGKMPKKADFERASAKSIEIVGGSILATVDVDKKNLTESKKYQFVIEKVESTFGDAETVKSKLYTTNTFSTIATVDDGEKLKKKTFDNGTLFMVLVAGIGTVHRYTDGIAVPLKNASEYEDLEGKIFLIDGIAYKGKAVAGNIQFEAMTDPEIITLLGTKEYVIVQSGECTSVYQSESGTALFTAIGALDEIFDDNSDKTLISVQNEYFNTNIISIKSAAMDFTNIEEFVEILNEDKDLAKLFTFSMINDNLKDEYVEDVIDAYQTNIAYTNPIDPLNKNVITITKDATPEKNIVTLICVEPWFLEKEVKCDTSLYIPYKTTDNFARHLAQHCMYTSLKTAPTHGIMGCTKLLDVNLNSVAKKVDSLVSLGLDTALYAKRANGKDMLDRNNMPYPIGRCISVVFSQYVVTTTDSYSYISNGAAGYAGMVSNLSLDQSSTNQPINVPTPMFELTNYQLGKLTQKGFVTFKQSYTLGTVVTDGVTMAPVDSPFRRYSATKIGSYNYQ